MTDNSSPAQNTNLGARMFRFPYSVGEAVFEPIHLITYKTTYDKVYIVDFSQPLSRYEVCYYAIVNTALVIVGQSRHILRGSESLYYHSETMANSKMPWARSSPEPLWMNPPEYFGMIVGRFIPYVPQESLRSVLDKRFGDNLDLDHLRKIATDYSEQFFEGFTEFWVEVLPGKTHKECLGQYHNRPLWLQWNLTQAFRGQQEDFLL